MATKTGLSGIAPHTEYVRTRVRCSRCGETVPRDAASDARCSRCAGGVAG